MDAKLRHLQRIQRSDVWSNGPAPEILIVADAYQKQLSNPRFYTIEWGGTEKYPLVARFTRFDFQQQVGDEYVIMWRDAPRHRLGVISGDEYILMFSD